jgi:hypothetical protein
MDFTLLFNIKQLASASYFTGAYRALHWPIKVGIKKDVC